MSAARAVARIAILGLWACATGCTLSDDGTSRPVRSPAWEGHADAFGFIPRDYPTLRVVVSGPQAARYLPEVLGAGVLPVTMRVRNVGAEDAPLPRTRLAFTAVRRGVPFACREESRPFPLAHEPAFVRPGKSVVLNRDLVCSMPVAGHYELTSRVRFGESDLAEETGSFTVDVTSLPPRGPVPYPERPGLYVALSGRAAVRGVAPDADADADATLAVPYEALVAFTNTRGSPIPLGAVHVAVRVEKNGVPIPCPSDAGDIWVHAPDRLPPGHTVIVRVPVPCNLPLEAGYDLVAWTTLGDGPVGEGSQLGPLHFEVTRAAYVPPIDYPDATASGRGALAR
jgi:hypothetical protein